MKIKVTKLTFATFLVSFGFLFLPFYMRSAFLPGNIAWFNFVSAIGVFLLINRKNTMYLVEKRIIVLTIYFVLSTLFLFSYMQFRADKFYALSLYVSWVLPIFLLFEKVNDRDVYLRIFKCWCKVLNIIVYFITLCFLLDKTIGVDFSEFFRILYGGGTASARSAMSAAMLGSRMVSYVGHPLFTTEIVLIFYVSNYVYGRLFEDQKIPIIYILVSFIDIALVGSKTGIVLVAAAVLVHNFQNKRIRYLMLVVFMGSLLYASGVFDTVIQRFIEGFLSGDMTSARSTSWDKLFATGLYTINPWTGQWVMDSTQTTLVAALEYPILKWGFLIGSVFAAALALILFIYPLLKIFATKEINLIVCMLVIVLDVNTFNTISTQRDALFLYCWVAFLIINAAIYINKDKGNYRNKAILSAMTERTLN